MSLTSSPDFQIRPEDKAFDTLFPADDPLTNSFDDYLNENYDLSDDDNKETFDTFLEFFEKEATGRGNGCLSPIGRSTSQEASPPQPWRKGLWCLDQNGASLPGSVTQGRDSSVQNGDGNAWNRKEAVNHKARGKAFTNFSRPGPRSPPHTPSHKGIKSMPTTIPRTAKSSRRVPQAFSREGTLSPKLSYARNQHNNQMAYQESLQRHLQNFHLLAGDEAGALSPPPSGRLARPEYLAQVNAANVARNGAVVNNQALTTPIADADVPYPSVEHGCAAVVSGVESVFYSNGANTMLTPHYQALNPADYLHDPHEQTETVWTAETLEFSIGSEHPYDSQSGYKYLGDMQQCWPPSTSSASQPDACHSYQEHCPTIAAPTPQRPTHQLLQNPVSPQLEGLGIHYSGIDSVTAGRTKPALSPLEPAYSYPHLPEIAQEPIHTFEDTSPFTTPRRRHPTDLYPSRSTSPTISPTNTKHSYTATSRSLRQASPSRQSARRKSIGAPKASSLTNSHHHNNSTSKAPRTPRTPKTPTGSGFGAIDFVNLTPKDSVKLLSDVAPSGSSKTRARRAQEARDKRRKLSEAAVRAVRRAAKAAGGDVGDGEVEALERAILA